MPVITYDYIERPFRVNGKSIRLYTPLLPIRLSGKHRMYPFLINSIVDSGADHNLMPAAIGEYLGLNIKKGVPLKHLGIGGVQVTAYGHKVTMYVDKYRFDTEVHFTYEQKYSLLGR